MNFLLLINLMYLEFLLNFIIAYIILLFLRQHVCNDVCL